MQAASSQRKRFADGTVASRVVWGGASGRGAPSFCGWNFPRVALSGSPAVAALAVTHLHASIQKFEQACSARRLPVNLSE